MISDGHSLNEIEPKELTDDIKAALLAHQLKHKLPQGGLNLETLDDMKIKY